MQIQELIVPGAGVFNWLLSLAVTLTSGEIHVAGASDNGANYDFSARPSSPLFNAQNTSTTLSEALTMQGNGNTILVVSMLNTGTTQAAGRVEIAATGRVGPLTSLLDQAIPALAPQQCWSMHVRIIPG